MRRWPSTKSMLVANLISNPWNIIQNLTVDSLSLKLSSNLVLGISKLPTLQDLRATIFRWFITEVPHNGHINVLHDENEHTVQLHVTVVRRQSHILWVVKPRRGVSSYGFLNKVYCLHLQVLLSPPSLYLDYPALNTKPVPSLESSVNMYRTNRHGVTSKKVWIFLNTAAIEPEISHHSNFGWLLQRIQICSLCLRTQTTESSRHYFLKGNLLQNIFDRTELVLKAQFHGPQAWDLTTFP